MPDAPPRRLSIVLFAVLVEGSLAGLAWGLGWMVGQPPLERCGLEVRGVLLGMVAALPMLVVFVLAQRSRWGPFIRMRRFFEEVVQPLFADCTLFDLALISLAAGVGEEMLFRGVIQAALARWLGTTWGVILASILFGLLHPITVTYVVIVTLMGTYLGLVWRVSGNLLVVIVAHAFYDFLALATLLRSGSPTQTKTEGETDSEAPPP